MNLVAALLILAGAAFAFLGSVGLLRLGTFFERVHAPTMGTTLGAALLLLGSLLHFSLVESRPVLHELLIAVFLLVTTPVTYLLLGRAALDRDGGSPEGERNAAETVPGEET
jgi:multicomponent K+:H+ antiporter subunit G